MKPRANGVEPSTESVSLADNRLRFSEARWQAFFGRMAGATNRLPGAPKPGFEIKVGMLGSARRPQHRGWLFVIGLFGLAAGNKAGGLPMDLAISANQWAISMRRVPRLTGVVLALACWLAQGDKPCPALCYALTDLGTLGGNASEAYALNDHGQVVGQSSNAAGYSRAFLYASGQMHDLGTLGGSQTSVAYDINNAGVVVGESAFQAFVYQSGQMQPLSALNGAASSALAINEGGWVVGEYQTPGGAYRAFRIVSGTLVDLGTLSGGYSVAYAINAAGQTVGQSDLHAFSQKDFGPMIDLGTLGAIPALANAINDLGQIVGKSGNRAFLYDGAGPMLDLGGLAGQPAVAYGINNLGQIVGESGFHGFLYDIASQTMLDLNDLLLEPTAWTITAARDINHLGQIAATGFNAETGQAHALLLTPVPEPRTTALATAAGLLVGIWVLGCRAGGRLGCGGGGEQVAEEHTAGPYATAGRAVLTHR